MSEVNEMLDEAIKNRLMEIESLEAGTEEMSRAVEDAAKLYMLKMDEIKNELEAQDKIVNRLINIISGAAWGIGTLGFNWYVFYKGLKYEEEGTFNSGTFRRFMNNFPKPFKK
jgi:hypothetical protein